MSQGRPHSLTLVVTEKAPVLLPPLSRCRCRGARRRRGREEGTGVSTRESPRFQGGEGQGEPGGPGEELWHRVLWLRLERLRPRLLQHRRDLQPQLGKNSRARRGHAARGDTRLEGDTRRASSKEKMD